MKKSTNKVLAKNSSSAKKPSKNNKAVKAQASSTLAKAFKSLKAKVQAMAPQKSAKKPAAKMPTKPAAKAAPAKAPVKAASPAAKSAPLKQPLTAKPSTPKAPHKSTGQKTPPQKIHLKPAAVPAPAAKNLKNVSGKGDKTPKNNSVEGVATKGKTSPESTSKTAGKLNAAAATLIKPSTKPLTKPQKAPKKSAATYVKSDQLCRETTCENMATTKGYCRLDYIKNWKKIKRKEMILKEGKLNQYIEELVNKYPDKYIDVIRQDLTTEVNFNKVIHDLELDESIDDLDYDGDSIDALIGGIRKDGEGFDDDEF
jgi:hypothetical protein